MQKEQEKCVFARRLEKIFLSFLLLSLLLC